MLDTLQKSVNKVAQTVGEDYVSSLPSYSGRKIIRDPVWGFHDLTPCFLVLLDSPYLQRLRHIYQTALTFHTYPSSVHSRLEHSLGTWRLASLMLSAIERQQSDKLPKQFQFEVQLAALLHDVGHGPFSHASEDVYGQNQMFDKISQEKSDFSDASPSEILSWCLLNSPTFGKLWETVTHLAKQDGAIDPEDTIEVSHVGRMILGTSNGLPKDLAALRHIVNGAFDADKLDYLTRDGHFTGLQVPIDADRLLWGLRLADTDDGGRVLAVDMGSISALEQVIFGKAQLYTQIYHHHKVRAAARLIYRLLENLGAISSLYGDLRLDDPAFYLALDDYDIIGAVRNSKTGMELIKRIKLRQLPKRCLVITQDCIGEDDEVSKTNWSNFRRKMVEPKVMNLSRIRKSEEEIAQLARTDSSNVMLDLPSAPKLTGISVAHVYFPGGEIRPLSDIFPATGWANAYEAYRSTSYVFALEDKCDLRVVRDASIQWLKEKLEVSVTPLASEKAKLPH